MKASPKDLANWIGGTFVNPEVLPKVGEIVGPASLSTARSEHVAFFFSKEYQFDLIKSAPGVLVTAEPFVEPMRAAKLPLWSRTLVVVCPNPYEAMGIISERFAESLSTTAHTEARKRDKAQIHPSAVIESGAEIGAGAFIDANCVIQSGAVIGAGTRLYPNCFVGAGAKVGEDGVLFPGVTLYEKVQIGDRVRLHAGCVIGADGFGYAPVIRSGKQTNHQKIYHFGRVIIGNDVEIGANSCVDRGTFDDTRVGDRVKIDNNVQVGHNVILDEGAVICGLTGVAGTARVGRFAYVGGTVGITNRVYVGDGAKVAAHTLVTKDVPAGKTVAGDPMRFSREHFRIHAALNKTFLKSKNKE